MAGPSVIVRVAKEGNFTQIENATLRDERLSFRATGLLAYLLSLPDGSSVDSRALVARKTEGRDAIQTAYRELVDLGYVHRRRRRVADTGEFTTTTYVLEVPDEKWVPPGPDSQEPGNPVTAAGGLEPGFQAPGLPGPGEPAPDNQAVPTGKTSGKTGGKTSSSSTREEQPTPAAATTDDDDDDNPDPREDLRTILYGIEVDEAIDGFLDALADHQDQAGHRIAHRARWKKTARTTLATVHVDAVPLILDLLERYPQADPRAVGRAANGDTRALVGERTIAELCTACDEMGEVEDTAGIYAKCAHPDVARGVQAAAA